MDVVRGQAVISLTGRDKGRYLAVMEQDESFVYVADGGLRPVAKPKKKNQKHISVTGRVFDSEVLENDRLLRKAIKDAFGGYRR